MRQPKALTPLFLTEVWERLGYYIVQTLLVLYLTLHFKFTDNNAYALTAEFGALIYVSPIIGGYIADKIMGFRYAILIGAVALFAGYLIISLNDINLFYWGMATLILGNGFLKPNISSFLGSFYQANDPRREGGFTIFYMGINVGSWLATFFAGYIQQVWGWSAAFITATIGMFIGSIIYLHGFKKYGKKGLPQPVKTPMLKLLSKNVSMGLLCLVIIFVSHFFLTHTGYGNDALTITGISLLIGLIYNACQYDAITRNKMFALIVLIMIAIIFWAMFFQIFSAVVLFIDRSVDRQLLGQSIPASTFNSLEPLFIIILGLPFAALWQKLHKMKRNPSLGVKFSLSMLFMAIAYFILVVATKTLSTQAQVYTLWLVLFFLLITIGEMLLSPIGLSMITELAPQRLVGLMMGVWFMSLGFGAALTGQLAKVASIPKTITDPTKITAIYSHAFLIYALLALAASIITLAMAPWIKKLICYHQYKQS